MATDIEIYKQNKLNELYSSYNTTLIQLNKRLMNNIKIVLNTRNKNKFNVTNNLIIAYNQDLKNLRNNLNLDILKIKNYVPEFIVQLPIAGKKKALLIGVNYLNTEYELSGCIDDTSRMQLFLTEHGFSEFTVLTDLTDIKPTKYNILNVLKNFLLSSSKNDVLCVYFSGHGSYTYDNNHDETDNKDEMIISSDLQGIMDDELKSIIQSNLKSNITLFGLFDSCHSGTIFDLKYNYLDSSNYNKYTENNFETECDGNVLLISGCMDSQTSSEAVLNNLPQGALTWSFIDSIKQSETISWRELIQSMRKLLKNSNFTQIPQISTDSFYNIDSQIFI